MWKTLSRSLSICYMLVTHQRTAVQSRFLGFSGCSWLRAFPVRKGSGSLIPHRFKVHPCSQGFPCHGASLSYDRTASTQTPEGKLVSIAEKKKTMYFYLVCSE